MNDSFTSTTQRAAHGPATDWVEETPAQRHRRNVADGFEEDAEQFALADRLTDLHERLLVSQRTFLKRPRWNSGRRRRADPVVGLYMWGGVGRGKTYLMDLFYDTLPFAAKRRLHFHRFMQHVHGELATLQQNDPLQTVAKRFAARVRVLCFDEFYVSDIGDAMILANLLKGLFDRGVALVATSNVAPQDLYENGLQRQRFLPAIDMIGQYTEVVHVGGQTDYRLRVLQRDGIYRVDGDGDALLASFRALSHATPNENEILTINNRPIRARYCAQDVAWFDFDALCAGPRSQSDYIELARVFSTVVLNDIPTFDADMAKEDQARRFISLIDEFYDRNVKVLFGATAPVAELYRGERLNAEWQRTASRVNEMQSDDYLRRTHRP